MHKQKGNVTAAVLIILFWAAMVLGYCLNIYQIVSTWDNDITGKFIFKVAGVVLAPLGSILGFIG